MALPGMILPSLLLAVFVVFLILPTEEVPGFDLQHTKARLREAATTDMLETKIHEALTEGDIELARELVGLADTMQVAISRETRERVDSEGAWVNTATRNTYEFGKGLVAGEGHSAASLAGSLISDFTVVGDLRDLAKEGFHYLRGEPVDTLTTSLAGVGLALTLMTPASSGGALSLKAPVSALKVARKIGALSNKLLRHFNRTLIRAVDADGLLKGLGQIVRKHPNITDLEGMKGAFSAVVEKHIKLEKLDPVIDPVRKIHEATGNSMTTIKLLRYADTPEDLRSLAKLSKAYGKRSLAVLKMLGKSALRVTQIAWKFATVLFGFGFAIFLIAAMGLMELMGVRRK